MSALANTRITDLVVNARTGALGGARVDLFWRNQVGELRHKSYYGFFARQFIADDRAATLVGEEGRRCYLIGRIREIERLSV